VERGGECELEAMESERVHGAQLEPTTRP